MADTNTALTVVTGGGSGIGRAMARALAARGLTVWIVGRRAEALEETARAKGDMRPVAADVATEDGRARVAQALPREARLRALVHNAGVLEPVTAVERLSLSDWRHNQAVNVEAPLFLTQALLPRLAGGRVLHVSSGAAHRPIPGWAAYCTAKAALHMLYRCLDAELAERGVRVGSLRPGVVDTDMQGLIREQSEADFPGVERFRALHREGRLHRPEEVGAFTAWLLLDCGADEFARDEWELEDTSHHRHWRRAD